MKYDSCDPHDPHDLHDLHDPHDLHNPRDPHDPHDRHDPHDLRDPHDPPTINPRFSDKRKPEIMVLNSRSGCFPLFPALFKSDPGKAVVPLSRYKSNPPIYRTKRCEATPSVQRTDFLCAEQRASCVYVTRNQFRVT